MRLRRTLGLCLGTLLAHRARSALAASGVAIGIAAVFLTVAIGDGAQAEVITSVGAMGPRMLVVRPAQIKQSSARKQIQGFVSSLKLEDAAAIAALERLEAVAPAVEGQVKIKTGRDLVATQVLGTTSAFFRVRSFQPSRGRVFDGAEDDSTTRVAVLGGRIAQSLFPDEEPVGQELRIGGVTFEVVGVLLSKGAAADGSDADKQVFIPVRTALHRVFGTRSLSRVFISVRETKDLDAVEGEVRSMLRQRHGLDKRDLPDDFAIQNRRRLVSAEQQTARYFGYLTVALAAIALVIGGSGILALMLLSVRERTPEIGLRMAVGARPGDILLQFLAEAMVLALAGGAVGAGLGGLGTWLVSVTTTWPVRLSADAWLLAMGMAATTGLLSGALPARNAAMLTPVRALGLE